MNLPGLGAPARRALASKNIQTLRDLSEYSESEIKKLHGMGPKAIEVLKVALAKEGFTFRNYTD